MKSQSLDEASAGQEDGRKEEWEEAYWAWLLVGLGLMVGVPDFCGWFIRGWGGQKLGGFKPQRTRRTSRTRR